MNKSTAIAALFLLLTGLVITGCSRIDESLPQDPDLTIHQKGIVTSSSPNFHGVMLKNAGYSYTKACMQCHGASYTGKDNVTSCTKCHTETYFHFDSLSVYNKNLFDNQSAFFHGKLISTTEHYSFAKCQKCHGTNYAGGTSGKSCLSCHSKTNGPEACNTCHGTPSDTTGAPATGFHASHLVAVNGADVQCAQCHTQYTTYTQAGHIDNNAGIELMWGAIAKTKTNDPANNAGLIKNDTVTFGGIIAPSPSYNASTKTCANVYCHGAFKAGNVSNTVSWSTSTGLKCGSCHGDGADNPLPTTGPHKNYPMANCTGCHDNVKFENGKYTITNKAKHIDGKLRLFGSDSSF